MKVNNKLMIQSYLVTSARYDFSVYEKRIIYRLVEMCQCALEGQKLNQNFQLNNLLYEECKEVIMPVAAFLKDEKDENYKRAKDALFDLNNKVMQYEDDECWKPIRIIEMPKLLKKGYVKFVLQKEIYDALLNFSEGFRKYELKTAMEFDTVYAMRFYELLSGKTEPITYSIENLKIMFQLENKYKETKDFIRRVIEPAQKELSEKAPFSFTYSNNCIRKKVISLTFFPYQIPANVDVDIEKRELQKRISLRWDLDKMVIDYLKQNYLFDDDGIRNNLAVLKEGSKKLDIMNFLSSKKRTAASKRNPIGWIIGAIKREIAAIDAGKSPSKGEKKMKAEGTVQGSSIGSILNTLKN